MKLSNRQLSLRGLRTFSVAARHKNFRLAAEELFVTASAVSHQIKSLEEEMGVALFARNSTGLELTATGRAFYERVGPLIDELDEVAATFRSRIHRATVRISVQPFFASELFVPRLAEFTSRHPEVDIHVDTTDESPEKHPASADLSIRLFRTPPTDLASDRLFPLRVVPACSPALKRQVVGRSKGKRTLKPFPMVVHAQRVGDWQTWTDAADDTLPEPTNIVHLNSMIAVVRAAEKGLGVALVPMPLSEARFASKRLVRLCDPEVATGDSYYLVHSPEAGNRDAVRALRQWALETFCPGP